MSAPLTLDTNLSVRLFAWANERFPFVAAIGYFAGYLVSVLFVRAVLVPSGAVLLGPADLLTFPAIWSFFLLLRIQDEHKDYELDVRNHPKRVLQSGLVTLAHLRVLGAFCVALEFATSAWRDGGFGPITRAWLLPISFAALMGKDFFATRIIGHRLVLAASLHMLVMPCLYIWMGQIGAGSAPLPWQIVLVAGPAFFGGFAFEVARKMKPKEDERPTVDSYTKQFGLVGAACASLGLFAVMAIGISVAIAVVAPGAVVPHVLVALFALLPVASAVHFVRNPSTKAGKGVEGGVGVGLLLGLIVLIATIISRRGLVWH